ncbi:hypothetical protein GCM10009533_59890 [Saccharopolyspora spinosporotrichia]|uniref:Cytochrome P450 n=1 Tax=Saccharopolyspora erythraea TaxID=1836 RepID=A0ABP3NXN4_SACER
MLVDEDGRPQQTITRNRFLLGVAGPYGHALHVRKPAARLADEPRVLTTSYSADALINEFGSAGEADLLTQYAGPLTLRVLTWLFGCPTDLGQRLLADMAHIADAADAGAAGEAGADLDECLRRLVHLKRGHPGRGVTSRLMAHSAQLSDDEVVHQLVILMGVSGEAQQNLISNALRLLLSDERFAGDLSGGSLPVEDALDEVLWADPPIANHSTAYPTREVHLDGVHLPRVNRW